MRSTRTTRVLLLGLSLSFTATAVAAASWSLWSPGPSCEDLDPETCFALTRSHGELTDFARLAATVLGVSGPLLGLAARDLSRRARAGEAS